jgi:hypothetical protein
MALVEGIEYPEHLFYDLDNQIWYEPLPDGTVRAGFTPIAMALAGEVLVFTPKRVGRDFEPQRSFATIEGASGSAPRARPSRAWWWPPTRRSRTGRACSATTPSAPAGC